MTPQLLLLSIALTADPAPPVDFDTDIVPVLTKAGCNAGTCHGAAAGRGGFHLSLFGSDPAADHDAIVAEFEGRRVNLVRSEASLLIAKPTGQLKHGGGERLDIDGEGVRLLKNWIAAGAERKCVARKLTAFDVSPISSKAERIGAEIRLSAKAKFDDVEPRDVTAWTVFTSTDPSAVEVSSSGKITIRRRGRHVVLARYLDRIVPIRVTLPFSDSALDFSKEPRTNFIDDEVLTTLEALRVPVSPIADDAAFLRRIRLDLTGGLPTPEEVTAFDADTNADKRTKLIERLLASDDFVEYWTHKLANLFRNRPQANENEGMRAFHDWLKASLKNATSFDQLARSALTSVGDSHRDGAVYFSRLTGDARSHAEHVSDVFLGARLQCANCHNHPLDRWTQDDYHGLAAIFAKLERGPIVKVGTRGAVTNPRTGENAIPRLPGLKNLDEKIDGRKEFAAWLTATDNPFFAKAIVNRLWKSMFGRGLVEPADDLRETNPATHPELLDKLAADFVKHGFDLRHTLRLIANSRTYARSSRTLPANADDDRYYSHALRRPLEPAVLADALADVTGAPEKFGNEPVGTRAIALVNPLTPSRSLDVLGRCNRAISCETETTNGGVPAMLHRLNGDLVNRPVSSKDGRLHRLIAKNASNESILDEFYRRAFGRTMTTEESRFWNDAAKNVKPDERTAFLEDAVWGILNSKEFGTNH